MKIHIETVVHSNIDSVWSAWNSPDDIKQWNAASDDWHTTESSVDLCEGGKFTSRMEAKDGSMGFDFSGTFTKLVDRQLIEYTLDDGRPVVVKFSPLEKGILIEETFEAETQNDAEHQRQGWQSILDNFARHVESKK